MFFFKKRNLLLLMVLMTFGSLHGAQANSITFDRTYGNVGKWRILNSKNAPDTCVAERDNNSLTLRIMFTEYTGDWLIGVPNYTNNDFTGGMSIDYSGSLSLNSWSDAVEFSTQLLDSWAMYNMASHIVKDVQNGSLISLDTGNGRKSWSLAGSSKALKMVQECARNSGKRPARKKLTRNKNVPSYTDTVGGPGTTEKRYAVVRDWSVYSGKTNGKFKYCVGQKSTHGSKLRLGYDNDQWQLSVPHHTRPDWSGQLEVDGRTMNVSGTAAHRWAITWLGLRELEAIKNGNHLILNVGKFSFDHTLSGTSAVILKIQECLQSRGVVQGAKRKTAQSPVVHQKPKRNAQPVYTNSGSNNCPNFYQYRAIDSGVPATVEFDNRTGNPNGALKVYWIDFDGKLVEMAIFNNYRVDLNTSAQHSFVIRDRGGRCYGGVYTTEPVGHNSFIVQ